MTTLSAEVAEAVRLRDAARLDTEWERKIYQAGMVREIVSSHVDLIERLFNALKATQDAYVETSAALTLEQDRNEGLRAQLEQARVEIEQWKKRSRANWDAARNLADVALKL